MIELTRLNGSKIVINAHLIESVEANPDTVITMYSDKKFVVQEPVEVVVQKTIEYNRKIFAKQIQT